MFKLREAIGFLREVRDDGETDEKILGFVLFASTIILLACVVVLSGLAFYYKPIVSTLTCLTGWAMWHFYKRF